ncbi:MAG TPA: response regulator transcription factor [Chloroflexi bacterium]|mgnify:CR=1 FL=1|nr:response regulator transcription factor [Chloroflexota bacterium]
MTKKLASTRLFIIDDHDTVREALEARLQATSEVDIVGCTGCWETGLQETERLKPDVVLLETKRADGQGLEALRCLTQHCPTTSVVVLTSYPDTQERLQAQRIGAVRYILKDIDTPQLVREIQASVRPAAMI